MCQDLKIPLLGKVPLDPRIGGCAPHPHPPAKSSKETSGCVVREQEGLGEAGRDHKGVGETGHGGTWRRGREERKSARRGARRG